MGCGRYGVYDGYEDGVRQSNVGKHVGVSAGVYVGKTTGVHSGPVGQSSYHCPAGSIIAGLGGGNSGVGGFCNCTKMTEAIAAMTDRTSTTIRMRRLVIRTSSTNYSTGWRLRSSGSRGTTPGNLDGLPVFGGSNPSSARTGISHRPRACTAPGNISPSAAQARTDRADRPVFAATSATVR